MPGSKPLARTPFIDRLPGEPDDSWINRRLSGRIWAQDKVDVQEIYTHRADGIIRSLIPSSIGTH
eukprot:6948483-Lingulodinium_polyedra.AAC.1